MLRTLLAVIALSTASLQGAETLAAVQARMDRSAAGLQSFSSKLKKVNYTAIIRDVTTETGTFLLKRFKGNDIRVRMEIDAPDPRSIALSRKRYEVYLPKLNTVQEYDLSHYTNLVDQFLLLGFGTPVKELLKSYDMKVTGSETVAGSETTRIELTPKSSKVSEHLKRVEMWIPLNDGNPVQQKFYEPSGDYFLSIYSDVKVNPQTSDADLQLKLPSNVKREYPQK